MANNLFNGLGDFMKGLSGFMPQDDPDVIMINAQTELSDLEKQETELFAEIGRQAYERDPSTYSQYEKLQLIRSNIESIKKKIAGMDEEKKADEAAKAAIEAQSRCPNCDYQNPEGTKFCQECGTKLGAVAKPHCSNCGAELESGTRFCGECGTKQGG